jgi:hypothetical protein
LDPSGTSTTPTSSACPSNWIHLCACRPGCRTPHSRGPRQPRALTPGRPRRSPRGPRPGGDATVRLERPIFGSVPRIPGFERGRHSWPISATPPDLRTRSHGPSTEVVPLARTGDFGDRRPSSTSILNLPVPAFGTRARTARGLGRHELASSAERTVAPMRLAPSAPRGSRCP